MIYITHLSTLNNVQCTTLQQQQLSILGFFWIALSIGLGLGLPAVQIPSILETDDKFEMSQSQVRWLSCISLATYVPGNLIGGFVAGQWCRSLGPFLFVLSLLLGF